MRRPYESPYRWRRALPVMFWRRCVACGVEFLWERGWRRFRCRAALAMTDGEWRCADCAPEE